tara:strand:- start:45 stop:269 length:225 start_codon:yes stop_codon:yes gene_type:complete
MKYYKIPYNKIEEFTALMEKSFKHNNIFVRMNNDNSRGIMQFSDELAPDSYNAIEDIGLEMQKDEWKSLDIDLI